MDSRIVWRASKFFEANYVEKLARNVVNCSLLTGIGSEVETIEETVCISFDTLVRWAGLSVSNTRTPQKSTKRLKGVFSHSIFAIQTFFFQNFILQIFGP